MHYLVLATETLEGVTTPVVVPEAELLPPLLPPHADKSKAHTRALAEIFAMLEKDGFCMMPTSLKK